MLSVIRRNIGNPPNLRLIEGDLFQLDKLVGSEKYDMVVSMRVLPHLEAKHIALSKFNSVLRPGGTAIFDFWNGRSFIGLGRRLLRRRLDVPIFYVDYKTMLKLIAKAGFHVMGSFAWGYPRLGGFSLDRVGDRLAKRFGYSVVFNAKKN
jgi:SAM-dependent methyltransferase